VRAVEDRVNEWVKASFGVRAMEMARTEAEALGAMALFGEKYGDWVRMVEVDEVSRELCGGTHVANTAEVGIVAIVSEGSSAANVRRIEALTGPEAIDYYRQRSDQLAEAGGLLGSSRDPVAAARRAAERLAELEEKVAELDRRQAGDAAAEISDAGETVSGITVITSRGQGDQHRLLDLADQIKQKQGDAAVVLGAAGDGKVALVASFSPSAVQKGANAVEVIREAAAVVGGGGGGRPEVAQAGGRDAGKLDEALETARQALHRALS
jgi:alanyl-tRNA synthetase